MKINKTIMSILFASLFTFALVYPTVAAEEQETEIRESISLIGEVNSEGQFVTDDGAQFELFGEIGDELKSMSGQRIQIMGTVMEEGDKKEIEVDDYMIIETGDPESEIQ